MFILGIETSCDETSVAVLDGTGKVWSNVIASQIERHQPFGGVVPEIASREHLKHLMPTLERALADAEIGPENVDVLAVTAGPGLIGALLVGVSAAQAMSYGLGRPLVAVNHLEGHVFSPYLRVEGPALNPPDRFLSLVLSGGHSSVYDVRRREDGFAVSALNRTRDDAAGEVFDKVAKFLGLPYPGGPHVERLAADGDSKRYPFSLPQFKEDSLDFSFSGLKSNAIRLAREEGLAGVGEVAGEERRKLADFCASFQAAIVTQILDRLDRVWKVIDAPAPTEIALAGGVAANGPIREHVAQWCAKQRLTVRLAERCYCTDNAAMIAFAGLHKQHEPSDPLRIRASSRLAI